MKYFRVLSQLPDCDGNGNGARFVVAHAKRQEQRGKNPSEPYRNERNPRKAFELALSEIRTYKPINGCPIDLCVFHMIEGAKLIGEDVTCNLNGVDVKVNERSVYQHIMRDWNRAIRGYIGSNVGPSPNPVLTDAELESDARIEEENVREQQKRWAEYKEKVRVHQDKMEVKLAGTPQIELIDEAKWQRVMECKDDFSLAVIVCADSWARLMQVEMFSGKALEDVADATSKESVLAEIKFVYEFAVLILAICWKHGERLKLWHNTRTKLINEGEDLREFGGVLLPADFTVE